MEYYAISLPEIMSLHMACSLGMGGNVKELQELIEEIKKREIEYEHKDNEN